MNRQSQFTTGSSARRTSSAPRGSRTGIVAETVGESSWPPAEALLASGSPPVEAPESERQERRKHAGYADRDQETKQRLSGHRRVGRCERHKHPDDRRPGKRHL